MAMRRIFWGFCRNWSLMSPLHSYTTFRAVPILASNWLNWRRYSYSKNDSALSPIRGVGDMESQLLILKKTLCIHDTESRRLPAPVMWWVADSPYRWVGESPTPRITDTESRRLRVSLSRGVDDSADWWYGESLFKEKINLVSIFRTFNS